LHAKTGKTVPGIRGVVFGLNWDAEIVDIFSSEIISEWRCFLKYALL
jgi:hypothetical protein